MSKPVAYALFAGAGGLHLGLKEAGFDIAVATDIEQAAQETTQLNSPEIPFVLEDARRLSGETLMKAAGGIRPDLIAGGPPCQGFSTLGDKLSADPRNDLFTAFARIVDELGPRFVLLENVKALTTMYGGRFRDHILRTFEQLGYRMHWAVLDAADYGVPQFRKRVFFFGTRQPTAFNFPAPSHGPNGAHPYATTWEAIGDLAGRGGEIPNHIVLAHSEKVIARYRLIPEGGRLPSPEKLPLEIRRKNFGNTYKRLHRGRPALTMVPGNNAFPIHPTVHRSLTPREAARLQTFPDSYLFMGDRRRQCILIGNAVPPRMGAAIGRAILTHMVSTQKVKRRAVGSTIPFGKEGATRFGPANNFVDLFCGAGGITLGLERAGWKPLLGADFDPHATRTHRHNFPDVPHLEADLSKRAALNAIVKELEGEEVGIVAGGAPCQGFSIFGKRRFVYTRGYQPHQDPRNRLVFAFVEMVKRIQPRWLFMENVPGLANLDGGMFLELILSEFRDAGYGQCEARILNAADYGVPQLRRRLIIIGNRTGHIIPWPKRKFFAEPKEWQEKYRTVGDVISDLASEKSQSRFSCHRPMNHKPLLVERYGYIPEGGRLDPNRLPPHLRSGYRTDEVKNYSHVFKRLHRDRPAGTMVPGHNAFPIHPWLDRALTVREAARIQTFPDEIEFLGPRQEQCIQVGNACPPLLAEVLGNNIRKAEVNGWMPGQVPSSALYALIDREGTGTDDDEDLLEDVA